MFAPQKLDDSLISNMDSPKSAAALIKSEDTQPTEKETNEQLRSEYLYTLPFSSQSYYMMRPVENIHIWIWILKDLAWAQDWYYPALIFGILALAWCAVLYYEAFKMRSLYEVYMTTATTIWLAANFVWMSGG